MRGSAAYRRFDAVEAVAQPVGAGSETEPDVARAARAEGFAGRQADLVFLREFLAEGHGVFDAIDREEGIKRCFRPRDGDPGQAREALEYLLAAGATALDHLRQEIIALLDGGDRAPLQEGRRT